MLEVVCVELAAVNNVVGLNVVGVLLDFESDILLCEDILDNAEDFSVRCGRCRYGDFLALQRLIVNRAVVSVCGFIDNADNRAVVLLIDKIYNILAFEGSLEREDFRLFFIALLDGENVAVSGSGTLDSERILDGIELSLNRVVGVNNCVVNVLSYVGNLSCLNLFELNIVGVILDVLGGCCDSRVVLELDVAELLKQQKRSRFICSIIGNCYLYFFFFFSA